MGGCITYIHQQLCNIWKLHFPVAGQFEFWQADQVLFDGHAQFAQNCKNVCLPAGFVTPATLAKGQWWSCIPPEQLTQLSWLPTVALKSIDSDTVIRSFLYVLHCSASGDVSLPERCYSLSSIADSSQGEASILPLLCQVSMASSVPSATPLWMHLRAPLTPACWGVAQGLAALSFSLEAPCYIPLSQLANTLAARCDKTTGFGSAWSPLIIHCERPGKHESDISVRLFCCITIVYSVVGWKWLEICGMVPF